MKVVDHCKTIERMNKDLEKYEELNECYEQQTETLHELFEKGDIDFYWKIIYARTEMLSFVKAFNFVKAHCEHI